MIDEVAAARAIRIVLALAVFATGALASQGVPRLGAKDFTLAGVPLGSDTSVIRRMLGAPDSIAEADDPSQAGPIPAWWYRDLRVVVLAGTEFHGWWITGGSRPTVRGLRVGAPDSEVRQRYGSPTSTSGDSLLVYCGRRVDTRPPCMYVWVIRHLVRRIYAGHNVD